MYTCVCVLRGSGGVKLVASERQQSGIYIYIIYDGLSCFINKSTEVGLSVSGCGCVCACVCGGGGGGGLKLVTA